MVEVPGKFSIYNDAQISTKNVKADFTCYYKEKSFSKYGPENASYPRYRVLKS